MNENEQKHETDKTICRFGGSVECFADGDSDKQNVRLKLYDGSIVKHWYWGNLAFDLETMKLAKKRTPILIDHDTSQRAGVGTKAIKEDGFVLEGRFLKSSVVAQEVREQADEGYPFEASLRFDPSVAKIVQVGENDTHEINGRTLKGPGTAIYNTRILEGSIVTFGALTNCATEVFDNLLSKGQDMSKETELTLDVFKADHTELFEKVFSQGKAEGEKTERDLFAAIAKECPDASLASKCFIEGKTPDESRDAFKEAEIKRLTEERDVAVEAAKNAANADSDAAARTEFQASDQSDAHDKAKEQEKPGTEESWKAEFAASAELQKEFGDEGVDAYVAYMKAERDDKVRMLAK